MMQANHNRPVCISVGIYCSPDIYVAMNPPQMSFLVACLMWGAPRPAYLNGYLCLFVAFPVNKTILFLVVRIFVSAFPINWYVL